MKKSNRILSILISTCMTASMFSFSSAVFAETQESETGTVQTMAETVPTAEAPEATQAEQQSDPLDSTGETTGQAETYKISTVIQPQNGGTITINPSEVSPEESVSYTIFPAAGHKLVSLTIGDEEMEITDPYGTSSGTFIPQADTTVRAVFDTLGTYRITTSVNSTARGSITKTSDVRENGSFTVKATAKKGYYVSDLKVDGKSVGSRASYTFDNVDSNHTVKAVFSKQIKIMLDAGHYANYNKSPVYSSYYESKMTWALHNYLKAELEKYGFSVGVTRASQKKDLAVYSRGLASKGYDLFLSLHSNSSSASTSDYPLIITQKGNTGDPIAKGLGKVIQNTMHTKQAYKIWQKLNSDGKTEYYGVLRGSKAAGVKGMIVEHSFHTNLAATKWLSSNANLKKMAAAEAQVLADAYGMTEDTIPSSDNNSSANPVPDPVTTVSTTEKVKVLVSDLNMRKSYSSSSQSMGKAKKNTVYQLKSKTADGKWGQIKSNGYWIYLPGYTSVVKDNGKTVASSKKIKVLVSNLPMRKSYGSKAKSMGKAKKNTVYQLKATTKNGKWGQIKSNGYWIYLPGRTKVVSKSTASTEKKASMTAASKQKVKVTVSSLNMRKSYSTKAKSMGKAKKNTVYQLKSKTTDGKWGQIKSNGYWIYLPGYTKLVK